MCDIFKNWSKNGSNQERCQNIFRITQSNCIVRCFGQGLLVKTPGCIHIHRTFFRNCWWNFCWNIIQNWLPNVQHPTLQGTTSDRAFGKVIFRLKRKGPPHPSPSPVSSEVFLVSCPYVKPCCFLLGGFKVSNIFYVHPKPWGNDPIWREYFSNGLSPPTSEALLFLWKWWISHFLLGWTRSIETGPYGSEGWRAVWSRSFRVHESDDLNLSDKKPGCQMFPASPGLVPRFFETCKNYWVENSLQALAIQVLLQPSVTVDAFCLVLLGK